MLDYRKIAMCILVPILIFFFWKEKGIHQPNGVLVFQDPEQINIPQPERRPIKMNDEVLEPLAKYKIRARVLSKERYWFDHGSRVSPMDLALGWGPMSDSKVLNELGISQGNRFYYLSWRNPPPMSEIELLRHSANVHVIPANDYIKQQIQNLKVGQVVELQGELVMVSDRSGGEWKSSLTRDDTGNGACELMRVTSVAHF